MQYAEKKVKGEMIGEGCLIQGFGVLLFLVSWVLGPAGGLVGFVVMLVFLSVGSAKAKKYLCGNCGNPLASKEVRMCPTCRSEFRD